MPAGLYVTKTHKTAHPLAGSAVGTSEQGSITKTRNLQSQGDFQSWEH